MMNDDMRRLMREGMASQPLWVQPMGKPPYRIKPINWTPPHVRKSLAQELAEGLENLMLGLLRFIAPHLYRERYIARAFPAWGRRNEQLKVLVLPSPRDEVAWSELVEHLADAAHASWARYMGYFLGNLEVLSDGALYINAGYVAALRRQIALSYAELGAAEQQADRDDVAHILPIIQQYATTVAQNLTDVGESK